MLAVVVALISSVAVGGFVFGTLNEGQNPAQPAVTGTALLAADFAASGPATSFTCSTISSVPYLTLTNTGTSAASVASVTITWAGSDNSFAARAGCAVGAAGWSAATTYLNFDAISDLTATNAVNPVAGQSFTGAVTLSNGAQLLFTGTWQ